MLSFSKKRPLGLSWFVTFTKKLIFWSKWYKVYSNRAHVCISSKALLSCRYFDSVPQFDWSVTELCLFNNTFVNFTYSRWCYLLSKFNQRWISPNNLERFSNTLYRKGTALENCWKFIDGKVQVICCPGTNQRVLYNGHKRVHSTKYQTVGVSNGLCGHLIGPFEGKKHDVLMFYESELLQD